MKKKIISILLSSAMIFSMGISTVSAAAADDTAATESIVVSKTEGITDTAYGKVRGFIDDGTYTFRGIPYAKADRFEMPEAPDTWDDVRNCLVYGSTAPITKMTDPDGGDFLIPHRYWAQSENCQNLNVWTQDLDANAKKPVMVWFHGGGYTNGSSIEGVHMKVTSGPAIEKPGEMAAILNNLEEGDLLFVDEIHRLNRQVEEVLYPAMEDYCIDIMIGKGSSARSVRLELPKFTLVGATTRAGLLTAPLRDRFGMIHHLEFYTIEELQQIIMHSARILDVEIEPAGAKEMARRSRGTPRLANRILKRVRDFAQVKYDGIITEEVARTALDLMDVDKMGLDHIDRNILVTIIEKFDGGPVGLDTLAAAIGEDAGTIEDVYEPYLIKNGFLNRTPKGRVVTDLTYHHLGLN